MIEVQAAVVEFLGAVVPDLRCFPDLIPRDAELPAIVITSDGDHAPTIGTDTGHDVVTVRLRLTDEIKPGVDDALTAYYRSVCDTLSGRDDSHGALMVAGYQVLNVSRTNAGVTSEDTDGRRYRHIGMTFEVSLERNP